SQDPAECRAGCYPDPSEIVTVDCKIADLYRIAEGGPECLAVERAHAGTRGCLESRLPLGGEARGSQPEDGTDARPPDRADPTSHGDCGWKCTRAAPLALRGGQLDAQSSLDGAPACQDARDPRDVCVGEA